MRDIKNQCRSFFKVHLAVVFISLSLMLCVSDGSSSLDFFLGVFILTMSLLSSSFLMYRVFLQKSIVWPLSFVVVKGPVLGYFSIQFLGDKPMSPVYFVLGLCVWFLTALAWFYLEEGLVSCDSTL